MRRQQLKNKNKCTSYGCFTFCGGKLCWSKNNTGSRRNEHNRH